MKTKINEVQEVLLRYLKNLSIGNTLLSISTVFIVANVVRLIISFIPMRYGILEQFCGVLNQVIYFGYLLGLVLCFAKNDMIMLMVSFGINTGFVFINIIMDIVRFVDLHNYCFMLPIEPARFLCIVVYVGLFLLCLKKYQAEKPHYNYGAYNMQNNSYMNNGYMNNGNANATTAFGTENVQNANAQNSNPTTYQNGNMAIGAGFCKNCGNEIKQGEIFCRKCGTRIEL